MVVVLKGYKFLTYKYKYSCRDGDYYVKQWRAAIVAAPTFIR